MVLPIIILAAQEALRSGAGFDSPGVVCLGGDALADGVVSSAAGVAAGYHDGGDPGDLAGRWAKRRRWWRSGRRRSSRSCRRRRGTSSAALPVQIFDWASRPQADFHDVAGAGIIVLLTLLMVMNAGAVFVRYRYGQRIRW